MFCLAIIIYFIRKINFKFLLFESWFVIHASPGKGSELCCSIKVIMVYTREVLDSESLSSGIIKRTITYVLYNQAITLKYGSWDLGHSGLCMSDLLETYLFLFVFFFVHAARCQFKIR